MKYSAAELVVFLMVMFAICSTVSAQTTDDVVKNFQAQIQEVQSDIDSWVYNANTARILGLSLVFFGGLVAVLQIKEKQALRIATAFVGVVILAGSALKNYYYT